ncbi:hypothetical protein GCM10010199_74070 [Dactylosporangium roseum]
MIPPGEWCAFIVGAAGPGLVRPQGELTTGFLLGEAPLAHLRDNPYAVGLSILSNGREKARAGRGNPDRPHFVNAIRMRWR